RLGSARRARTALVHRAVAVLVAHAVARLGAVRTTVGAVVVAVSRAIHVAFTRAARRHGARLDAVAVPVLVEVERRRDAAVAGRGARVAGRPVGEVGRIDERRRGALALRAGVSLVALRGPRAA